ncbi:hypothetical protein [Dactylosporangium sp. NPDC051484]|uniref:hypothetical protein n=1 Tax=Dactylosporangium sp. NPDC051484 TaxID=3154942 RepID=UPI003450C456
MTEAPAEATGAASAVRDFIAGRRPPRRPITADPPPSAPSPAPSTSLDLSGPESQPVLQSVPHPDLAQTRRSAAAFTPRRTDPSAPTVLTAQQPTVVLSRLQSGIGALTFEAAWPAANQFLLGCTYQLRSGRSSVLRPTGSATAASGPLVIADRNGHQIVTLDLLAARHIERLLLFGMLSAAPPQWGGTLVVTTAGQARIEIPLLPPRPQVTALLSLYNIDGEFVLRAEMDCILGQLRDACLAFGYDRIAWRDANTPAA